MIHLFFASEKMKKSPPKGWFTTGSHGGGKTGPAEFPLFSFHLFEVSSGLTSKGDESWYQEPTGVKGSEEITTWAPKM